jgi:hypothetical protein
MSQRQDVEDGCQKTSEKSAWLYTLRRKHLDVDFPLACILAHVELKCNTTIYICRS